MVYMFLQMPILIGFIFFTVFAWGLSRCSKDTYNRQTEYHNLWNNFICGYVSSRKGGHVKCRWADVWSTLLCPTPGYMPGMAHRSQPLHLAPLHFLTFNSHWNLLESALQMKPICHSRPYSVRDKKTVSASCHFPLFTLIQSQLTIPIKSHNKS